MPIRLVIFLAAVALIAADKDKPDPVKEDLAKLQGTWQGVYVEFDGKYLPASLVKRGNIVLDISGDTYSLTSARKNAKGSLYLDPAKTPKTIDGVGEKREIEGRGIYHIEGDTLWICGGKTRPKGFTTKNNGAGMIMLKRIK